MTEPEEDPEPVSPSSPLRGALQTTNRWVLGILLFYIGGGLLENSSYEQIKATDAQWTDWIPVLLALAVLLVPASFVIASAEFLERMAPQTRSAIDQAVKELARETRLASKERRR